MMSVENRPFTVALEEHYYDPELAATFDGPEGRAVMAFLRASGIPFIAAWGAIPGSTSGAHIHVGQASPRLTVRRATQVFLVVAVTLFALLVAVGILVWKCQSLRLTLADLSPSLSLAAAAILGTGGLVHRRVVQPGLAAWRTAGVSSCSRIRPCGNWRRSSSSSRVRSSCAVIGFASSAAKAPETLLATPDSRSTTDCGPTVSGRRRVQTLLCR